MSETTEAFCERVAEIGRSPAGKKPLRRKGGARVGIDIAQAAVAGVQLKSLQHGYELTKAAVQVLPSGLVAEGQVIDVDRLAAELKSFWKASKFSGKRFFLAVANQKIVVRVMDFPLVAEKELRAAIEFQGQEAIPIPLDEAVFDFQILSTIHGEGGEPSRQKVLVAAARRAMLEPFIEAAKKAGLTIEGIDLQAFALMRSAADPVSFLDFGADESDDVTALINIDSGITSLVMCSNGRPRFTRIIDFGSETFVQALVDARGIDREEADVLRLTVGLPGRERPAIERDPIDVTEIQRVFDIAGEVLIDEIRRSIDYFYSQDHSGRISSFVFSGEGSLTRNGNEYLAQGLHMEVRRANSLQHITANKTAIPQPELEIISPRLSVAIGLAMQDEE